ncbi:MAG: GNAT family N-acetyltransferase [Nocardioidaceae bacterium]
MIATRSLPPDVSARPLSMADVDAVTALMAVCELDVLGEVLIERADIIGDWQRPSFDLAADTVGVFCASDLVAYAEVHAGRRAEVFVHPRQRARGIGTALMEWSWEVARRDGGRLVGQTVSEMQTDAIELFVRNGYRQLWTSWILTLPQDTDIAPQPLPDGVTIRPFVPGRDEQVAYRTIEDAFNEWPDRDPSTYGDWAAATLLRPGFEPWHLQLAVRGGLEGTGDDVLAACLLSVSPTDGWVNQIAVRRDCRGHGLGRALLARAFGETRARGMRGAGLNTDSRTGALGLYTHIGMVVTSTFVHWAKTLDRAAAESD